jgi:ATP/maltotriose-dependent transcriptional regulator MalT
MEDEAGQEIPAGRRHIIERPRLTRLLDEASARVIMLVAPAGYGKTTLARQWLANRPHAWYQATADSADLAALGIGVTEAGAQVTSEIGRRFREALLARRNLDGPMAADFLSADFEAWPEGAWLVIDDYQWLAEDAEEILDRLTSVPTMRLLVTSRRRPRWASPRKLLYGEAYELGQSALAMNADEANEVLRRMEGNAARGLVALANGWPAVIGLASFADPSSFLNKESLPPELHAYIAEELYDSVKPTAQQALCALSLLPLPSCALSERLIGAEGSEALAEGVRVGFLTEQGSSSFYIHPLLRTFLRRKLEEFSNESRNEMVEHAITLLISEGLWEGAFEVIDAFRHIAAFDSLLSTSLYPLLNDGRISTIRKFVGLGDECGLNLAVLDLARAELAFLEGFHERARSLAYDAGRRLMDDKSLSTKAFCRAGQSAYFSDDPKGAIEHFQQARGLGGDRRDERSAIWGHFLASVELEDDTAVEHLQEFEASGITLDDTVRTQNGRLHLATRLGGSLWQGLEGSERIGVVVADVRDPTVRASFWHAYAGALRVAAMYGQALSATETALHEVDTFHLEFARAHINLARAGIFLATERYSAALELLDKIEALGRARGDIYLQMNECTLRCRMHLLQGDADAAVTVTERTWPHVPSTGQYGEFLACQAIARHRAGGNARDALEHLDIAKAASRENEASQLSAWGRALVLLGDGAEAAPPTVLACFHEDGIGASSILLRLRVNSNPEFLIAYGRRRKHQGSWTRASSISDGPIRTSTDRVDLRQV